MIIAAMMLAAALVGAAPRPVVSRAASAPTACPAVSHTGTFRIVTKKAGGTALGLGLVVLENIDGCLEATFITDDAGPAIIDGLSVAGDTVNGNLRLSTGSAKVSLQFDGTTVAGSITQGRDRWTVEGRKTS